MRCDTCTHWTQDDSAAEWRGVQPLSVPYNGDVDDLDASRKARNVDVGMCQAAAHAPDVKHTDPVPLLMVVGSDDYWAAIFTRRDFSCVLHAATRPDAD